MSFEYFVVLLSLHVGTHVSEFASEKFVPKFSPAGMCPGFQFSLNGLARRCRPVMTVCSYLWACIGTSDCRT